MATRAARRAVLSLSSVGLALLGACAAPSAQPAAVTVTTTAPAVTVTLVVAMTGAVSTVTASAAPTGTAIAFRDGQYLVGRDIQPGTYRAAAGGDVCYWERQDESGDLIDNGFGTVATIRSSDFSFQSNRCGSWSRVG